MSTLSYAGYTEWLQDATLTGLTSCQLSSTQTVETLALGTSLYCRLVDTTGSTITFISSIYSIGTGSFSEIQSICALSSNTFVVVYRGASDYLYAVAGTISSNTITLGTAVNVSNSVAVSLSYSITNVASNSYVIAYYNNTNIILRTVS